MTIPDLAVWAVEVTERREEEMQTDQSGYVTHGPYQLVVGLLDGRLIIKRQAGHYTRGRTVAFVDSLEGWDRFVAALKTGASEVDAVHAIDA